MSAVWMIFLLMGVSIAVRTDNLIWCVFLVIFDTFSSKRNGRKIALNAIQIILLIVVYMGINQYASNGGWWIVFYNTFINKLPYPLTMTPDFSFKEYAL